MHLDLGRGPRCASRFGLGSWMRGLRGVPVPSLRRGPAARHPVVIPCTLTAVSCTRRLWAVARAAAHLRVVRRRGGVAGVDGARGAALRPLCRGRGRVQVRGSMDG